MKKEKREGDVGVKVDKPMPHVLEGVCYSPLDSAALPHVAVYAK